MYTVLLSIWYALCYLNWKSLTKITAPSGTSLPTIEVLFGNNKVVAVSSYHPGDDVICCVRSNITRMVPCEAMM